MMVVKETQVVFCQKSIFHLSFSISHRSFSFDHSQRIDFAPSGAKYLYRNCALKKVPTRSKAELSISWPLIQILARAINMPCLRPEATVLFNRLITASQFLLTQSRRTQQAAHPHRFHRGA